MNKNGTLDNRRGRNRWAVRGGFLMMAAALGGPVALGQGLLDIGPSMLEDVDIPVSGSFYSALGWDSDAGSRDSGFGGRASAGSGSEGESVVWQNSLSLNHSRRITGRDRLSISANYTNLWYFDPPPGVDEMDNNGRLSLNYTRQVTRKFSLSEGLYISYETEPNYDIGLSVTQPTSGYFLASNRLSGTYQWTHRFSTTTGYTFSTILYEDDSLENESYYRHRISQDFRYAFKRRLSGNLSYRYAFTQYEEDDGDDSSTHTILAGLSYQYNRRLSMTGGLGVDYRTYEDEFGNEAAPHFEFALSYIVAKRTSLRWSNLFSLDDTGRSGAQTGYTYRSTLGVSHGFTRRLQGNLSLSYIHSQYDNGIDGFDDGSEDTAYVSAGLGYILWRNISMNASYTYSYISEDGLDDYTRSRVFVGISYSF